MKPLRTSQPPSQPPLPPSSPTPPSAPLPPARPCYTGQYEPCFESLCCQDSAYRWPVTISHYSLLLTTCYSLLATHYSLLTTHYSTIHHSLLTTHHSPLTPSYSLLPTPYSLLTTHYSTIHHYSITAASSMRTSYSQCAGLPPTPIAQRGRVRRSGNALGGALHRRLLHCLPDAPQAYQLPRLLHPHLRGRRRILRIRLMKKAQGLMDSPIIGPMNSLIDCPW